MKLKLILGSLFLATTTLFSQQIQKSIPHLQKVGEITQLVVDNKPLILLSGELHNSTASSLSYFKEAVDAVRRLHVNSVLATITWEQFEPREGEFDYTLIDGMIEHCTARNLKLVVIWFASWKNGESSYSPLWVKNDTKRFFRILTTDGKKLSAISPLCDQAMKADAKAFASLMRRIKEKDTQQTVVMAQPENEVGAFAQMDYGKQATALYNQKVPRELMKHITTNQKELQPELLLAWKQNGSKTAGNWKEVFGEQNFDAQNFFLSWQYASYIEQVAQAGRKEYNIPMFVNAWLVQHPGELPGKYPNGGPVSRVMDIYKAAAPSIDFICPDIYLSNFREVCSMYHAPRKGNPLFIPECERSNPGKAYYALSQHDAIGFAPFGVESIANDINYQASYYVLNELLPIITQYQGRGKMRAFIKEKNEKDSVITLGSTQINIKYDNNSSPAYGIIIETKPGELLVAGINCRITVGKNTDDPIRIAEVLEGGFENGNWHTRRQLNGDETWHNSVIFVKGRSYSLEKKEGDSYQFTQEIAPSAILFQELEKKLQNTQIKAPGIYKVKLYTLK